MKIAILGAGSIGCFVGGAWQAAGVDVAFVGRPRIGDEIGAHGLTLTDMGGWSARIEPGRIRFSTDPAMLGEADIVALCVKSQATRDAAAAIAAHARADAAVISFQNGVGNPAILRGLLPHTVLAGMVGFNVAHVGPGRWHRGTFGDVVAEDHPVTRALAPATGDGPARLKLAGDMTGIAWGKLLLNLNNAVNALSGRTLLAELKDRGYRRVLAAAQRETLGLLAAAGIVPAKLGPLPPQWMPAVVGAPNAVFNTVFLRLQRIDAAARSSMADDFAARRPTEIDALNGEVVRLAASMGRPAPVNQAIVDLVRAAEAGGRQHHSPAELCRIMLEGGTES